MTGELLSDLYAVQVAPLTPVEAGRADPEFFTLLDDTLHETSPLLRDVAQHTLSTLATDPATAGHLPSSLTAQLSQIMD